MVNASVVLLDAESWITLHMVRDQIFENRDVGWNLMVKIMLLPVNIKPKTKKCSGYVVPVLHCRHQPRIPIQDSTAVETIFIVSRCVFVDVSMV